MKKTSFGSMCYLTWLRVQEPVTRDNARLHTVLVSAGPRRMDSKNDESERYFEVNISVSKAIEPLWIELLRVRIDFRVAVDPQHRDHDRCSFLDCHVRPWNFVVRQAFSFQRGKYREAYSANQFAFIKRTTTQFYLCEPVPYQQLLGGRAECLGPQVRNDHIEVSHLGNGVVRNLRAVFPKHRRDLPSQPVLDSRVQRQLEQRERDERGGSLEADEDEDKGLLLTTVRVPTAVFRVFGLGLLSLISDLHEEVAEVLADRPALLAVLDDVPQRHADELADPAREGDRPEDRQEPRQEEGQRQDQLLHDARLDHFQQGEVELAVRFGQGVRVHAEHARSDGVGGEPGHQSARLPPRRTGFNARPGHFRVFACGNRAGRCRWSASFIWDVPLISPFNSGAAPYTPQSPYRLSNLFTHSFALNTNHI
ncbi:hypothetical protein PR048_027501 [Dryococelus australis]|uniref:Uncharacterized protein n=1 Tax=Dryococelus australis TaxID=614101 RepID=A0ABQ9GGP7_9NEOP|nr:hypothetical protein PR048_027501 [Dryococelus australis]